METIIRTFGGEFTSKQVSHEFQGERIQPFNGDYTNDNGRVIKR